MERVIIESPLGSRWDGTRCHADEISRNVDYARRAILHSLALGEAPFASHALYPQAGLDDAVAEERRMGMEAGFKWGEVADRVAVYVDYGITKGMREGMVRGAMSGIPIEERTIGWAECSSHDND